MVLSPVINNSTYTDPIKAKETFRVNYFGTWDFTNSMFDLVENNGKILFMGSIGSQRAYQLQSKEMNKRYKESTTDRSKVDLLVEEYLTSVEQGTNLEKGWCNSEYRESKLAIEASVLAFGNEEQV